MLFWEASAKNLGGGSSHLCRPGHVLGMEMELLLTTGIHISPFNIQHCWLCITESLLHLYEGICEEADEASPE